MGSNPEPLWLLLGTHLASLRLRKFGCLRYKGSIRDEGGDEGTHSMSLRVSSLRILFGRKNRPLLNKLLLNECAAIVDPHAMLI